MGWDQGYKTPDEVHQERMAALEAQQRAKLSQFERRLLDYLGEISASLQKLAENTQPFYEVDGLTGEIKVHHGVPSALRDALIKSGGVAGEGDVASAEPVDGAGPGSARPDTEHNPQ